jgi:anti-sigma factor RsiW
MKRNEKKLIHKALDGEATRAESRDLEKRLSADGRLKTEFRQLKQVVKETTRIRLVVPQDFTRKVLDETRRFKRPPGPKG